MVSHERLDHPAITLRQAGLWAIALLRGDDLVAVAIAGCPVSGELQSRGYLDERVPQQK
jgi:hypothetical protein